MLTSKVIDLVASHHADTIGGMFDLPDAKRCDLHEGSM